MFKSIFTYPWDLHDEGADRALDIIREDARLGGVSLAVAYHVAAYFLPHNPRRTIYQGEEGMLLFRPDPKRWQGAGLQPHVSTLVADAEWLPRLTGRIRERKLELTAWTVYLYNHNLGRSRPDCAKRDALGNSYPAQLCPANPDVRRYAVTLTADLAAQCRPDALYIESLSYLHFGYGFLNPKILTPLSPRAEFLLGLCFCDHCVKAAGEGLDATKLRRDVAAWLEEDLPRMPGPRPEPAGAEWRDTVFDSRLQHYLASRVETATSLYEEVVRTARAGGVARIETAQATPGGVFRNGLNPDRVHRVTDRVGVGVPTRAEAVTQARQQMPAGRELLANVQPSHLTDEAAAVRTVREARAAGVDGFTFYNYGLLRLQQLRWIGSACKQVLEG